jgi:cobalt-zinc-cadmium efflux system outer membrane protein
MFFRLAAIGVATFAVATFAVGAQAQTTPAYEALLRQAETTAPRLAEIAATLRAAQGRAIQAAAIPNPQLGLEVENFAGKAPYGGFAHAQTTLSLSEPLEIAGQRSARVQAGRADLAFHDARSRQLRADFAYDLAIALGRAEVAQSREQLLAADLGRSEEDLRVALALVKSGREAQLRVVQAEAALAGTQADLDAARADALETLASLSSLVGAAQPYSAVGTSLLDRASPAANFAAPRPAAPAVSAAEAERDAAEHRIRIEQKRALPVISVSLGLRRFAGEDATALVGGLSVAVPLFDRNRGAIAASRAERDSAAARLAAARLAADAAWRSASALGAASASRVSAAQRGEDAAREAYRLARIGYEAGRSLLVELLATRRALTEAQIRSLEARFARVQAEASFARLGGRIPYQE